MTNESPERTRARIAKELQTCEENLSRAKSRQTVLGDLRSGMLIRKATQKRDRLKQLLAEHDAKHPREV
jgi:hypothetical protein